MGLSLGEYLDNLIDMKNDGQTSPKRELEKLDRICSIELS